jgi:GNAT superfamily N-acetyltransferase
MPALTIHRARSTADEDLRQLQAVLEGAPGYGVLVEGRPPSPQAASEMMAALPPGKTQDDKFVLLFRDAGRTIGCADVIRGYPQHHVAYIGLLLFVESAQGRSWGHHALREIEGLGAGWACTTLRIAVIESNVRALAFWQREGFVEILRKPAPGFTGPAIVMERGISA